MFCTNQSIFFVIQGSLRFERGLPFVMRKFISFFNENK